MGKKSLIYNRARPWLEHPYFDPETRRQVQQLWNHPSELEDAFFADLKFGTGGLRGVMGVGTSRMNIYTVRKATQGFACYLKKKGEPSKGVVIGYDSRHYSQLFAEETARVLVGNQIAVFLCRTLKPTPFISFACRYLKTQAGIMITASHNPKEYNGYKVFWEDGAQIVHPHDQGIMDEIEKNPSYTDVCLGALDSPLMTWVSETVDQAYLDAIASHTFLSKSPKTNLKICYSSLHGAGITFVPTALERCGFSPPLLVSSQCIIDGDFPTVSSPNPESPSAVQEGIELLKKTKSDLLLVTDPDSDRLGIATWHQGKPISLNGNELAAIATYYLCETLSQQQLLRKKSSIITTIVTTPLIDKIAEAYQVKTVRVLTGFKYIGEKLRQWESTTPSFSFLFGAEESHGYLIGTYCRDKDAVSAACFFASLASDLKSQGKTCVDLLHEIYAKFGVFQEKTISLSFTQGKKGLKTIESLMQMLRESPLTSLGDQTIVQTVDYLCKIKSLPRANVLRWILKDGSIITLRPSGTEPTLKIYLSSCQPSKGKNLIPDIIEECQKNLHRLSNLLQAYFALLQEKRDT